MARRKKRAATVAKDVTPTQEKNKTRAIDRLKFNQINVDKELEKMTRELKMLGEKMIKTTQEAHDEFILTVPKDVGNMTLKQLFDAGYMLDYGMPTDGKFVSLGPCHFEIKEDVVEATAKSMPAPRQTIGDSRQTQAPRFGEILSTPAPGAPILQEKFITPKVVPLPKRGHVVVYTENGSPYLLNLSTMKAKQADETAPSSASTTRSTRTTRAARAAASRQ